jgi:D-glucuronyl C5-epimerase C-terminus
MSRRPPLIAAAIAALAFAAPAAASPVLVYDGGHVTTQDDPALPPAEATNPVPDAPRQCAAGTPTASSARAPASPVAHAAVVSVSKALRRAYATGRLDRATYFGYRETYSAAKSSWHRLGGNGRVELGAVITTVNSLAARGLLTPSRMAPTFLELQRNTQWWSHTSATPAPTPPSPGEHVPHKTTACTTAGTISAGPRVQFKGDPLTFQYYPGSGLRLQPLANFGAANALYNACKGINTEPGTPCEPDKLRSLLDRLIATATRRAGFLAWEYYFPFGGGRPPWVSGIATGSALSALTHAAALFQELADQQPAPTPPSGGTTPTGTPPPPANQSQAQPPAPPPHDPAYYLGIAKQALPVYAHAAPLGIRAAGPRGNHYLIYSFNKGLRVGNAFLESLIGLWDYWQVSGDKQAHALFIRGDREAKHELPLLDTGAWSLYSLGGAEADLNYQRVIRDFAQGLCDRTKETVYCSKAAAWDADLHRPARVSILGPKATRSKKPTRIAIRVDKISCLSIQVLRGKKVLYQPTWYFPRGVHSFVWTPPKAGTYHVHVLARDLMSRQSRADASLRVLPRH